MNNSPTITESSGRQLTSSAVFSFSEESGVESVQIYQDEIKMYKRKEETFVHRWVMFWQSGQYERHVTRQACNHPVTEVNTEDFNLWMIHEIRWERNQSRDYQVFPSCITDTNVLLKSWSASWYRNTYLMLAGPLGLSSTPLKWTEWCQESCFQAHGGKRSERDGRQNAIKPWMQSQYVVVNL